MTCYCGQGSSYAACCEPLHLGRQQAQTAEQLMRSRYSAFFAGQVDYLLATHHPAQHDEDERQALERSCGQQRWVHLDIRGTFQGGRKDQRGEVEFVAWFVAGSGKDEAAPQQLHERSRFVREGEQWLYVDGDMLPPLPQTQPDLGRNAPCWCGSGAKFKHCHQR